MPRIESLGHVGIYAEDLMKQRDFYTRVLGLTISDEELEQRGMTFLSADPEREHHEFVLMKGRVTNAGDKVIQQISFIVPSLDDLKEFHARLLEEGIEIDRIVSHGIAFGMYFFDPEGNRIELYVRTPYKVPQPLGDVIDLSMSNEELEEIAKARIPAAN
ncbi:MAG: VOC family protein [Chloroflexi bacterium]|nr:VOC family protein [Chloroflexota bacterium]